ncbi:MAG TPA: hypothetical protein VEA69_24130 [Tepidisphaeraceae bacterium]|nr:hypothetical protein [Tepidisphaeraceae bacterium]
MIFSRFGTRITLVSKSEDAAGQLRLQGTGEGMEGVREYGRADLKADDGGPEIDAAIAALPWKDKR